MTLTTSLGCALAAALIGVSGCPGSQREPAAESTGIRPSPPAPPPEPVVSPFPPKGAENTPFGARIGMELGRFQQIFPEQTFPKLAVKSPDGQVGIHAMVHGLDGKWTYTFEGGKLKWVLFDKYIDEITKPNFERCLAATDAIIQDYTKQYGPPASAKVGPRTFKDPYVDHHWGYEVMEMTWKADGMKFHVDFDFMGGKGSYHLLVKMEFQREDYPYF
jgi:hypothetical protein